MKSTGPAPGEIRVLRSELLEAHRELNKLRTQNEQLIDSNKDLSQLLLSTEKRTSSSLRLIVAYRSLVQAEDRSAALRDAQLDPVGQASAPMLLIPPSEVQVLTQCWPTLAQYSVHEP